MAALPPFHGRMEVATVNGVTGLVQVGPGGVPLPDDGLAPGPGLLAPGMSGPNLNGPIYAKPPGT